MKTIKINTRVFDKLNPKLTGKVVSKPFKLEVSHVAEKDNKFYAIQLDKSFLSNCREHCISIIISHHSNLEKLVDKIK